MFLDDGWKFREPAEAPRTVGEIGKIAQVETQAREL